jgi:hypothetical protein
MNEKDQNFDQLKRLLKLKQHELPPRGYFDGFSGQVIARLRTGETFSPERTQSETSWFVFFLRLFEAKPGLVGGFATSLCLLLLGTVIFTERSEVGPSNVLNIAESGPAANAEGNVLTAMASPALPSSDATGGIVASTNPLTSLQPVASLFGQSPSASLFQPAGFVPAQ